MRKYRSISGDRKETLPHERKYRGGKSYPLPLWNGILEHCERIGPALWEFVWLLDKITVEKDGKGIVLGGAPVKIARIAGDLGRCDRTIRSNLDRLQDNNYIKRTRTPFGFTIEVLNSRKFGIWGKKEIGNSYRSPPNRSVKNAGEIGNNTRSDRQKYPVGSAVFCRNKEDSAKNTPNNSATNLAGAVTLLSAAAEQFSTNTELDSKAATAFLAIGFEKPFGQPAFQEVFLRRFADRNGEWLTTVMEAAIQECNQSRIGIPPQFFDAKRDVEKREQAEFETKHRTAPL